MLAWAAATTAADDWSAPRAVGAVKAAKHAKTAANNSARRTVGLNKAAIVPTLVVMPVAEAGAYNHSIRWDGVPKNAKKPFGA
jgi:hypothetical protein